MTCTIKFSVDGTVPVKWVRVRTTIIIVIVLLILGVQGQLNAVPLG